jgi:hypothetical protein
MYAWISKLYFSLSFSHKNLVCTSPFPHNVLPAHIIFSRFDHPNNISWVLQIIKLLIMQFSPLPQFLRLSKAQIFSSALCSQASSAYFPPPVWAIIFQTDTRQQVKL